MKRSNLLLACLALAFASTLCIVAPAVAGDQVPLQGSFDGQSVQSLNEDGTIQDEITSTGNASHLGQFGMVIDATVVRPFGSGTIVLVAANGDTVTATFTGMAGPSGTPGVALITEHATITGGTGRFAGATGSFDIVRLFVPATGEVTGTIDGSISSVGRSKR
jgi:hypothetical protein